MIQAPGHFCLVLVDILPTGLKFLQLVITFNMSHFRRQVKQGNTGKKDRLKQILFQNKELV
jgi:hypothetical protein